MCVRVTVSWQDFLHLFVVWKLVTPFELYDMVQDQNTKLSTSYSHLFSVISRKEKMSVENDFTNFFQVLSGQLKSRV